MIETERPDYPTLPVAPVWMILLRRLAEVLALVLIISAVVVIGAQAALPPGAPAGGTPAWLGDEGLAITLFVAGVVALLFNAVMRGLIWSHRVRAMQRERSEICS